MIHTFSLYDLDLKDYVLDLINKRCSFSVKLILDDNGDPHHWEVES